MPRKKTATTRRSQATSRFPRRPLEVDVFMDQFLTLVCNTSRRYILELLAQPDEEHPDDPYELRSGEIAAELGLSTATTSEHLHLLANANLIVARKQGTAVYYRLANHTLVRAFRTLLQALDDHYQQQQADEPASYE